VACTVLLLGCSFPSNKTDDSQQLTNSGEGLNLSQQIITGDLIADSQEIPTNDLRTDIIDAQIGDQSFRLEVSDDKAGREVGLMYRESMQYNEGMLFVFDKVALHRFWMKNTLIPLDILWLDENKKIIDFQTAAPCYEDPCPILNPSGTSKYVIELPAGSFVEQVGATVVMDR